MRKWLRDCCSYVKQDWSSNPWRAAGEAYNYVTSAVSSAVFAATVPNPPFMLLYPLWMSGLIVMIFCAISRGSTGILALCITMLAMDSTGFLRLLLATWGSP
jgi:hypothetical protein